jgi:hypothetical protein
MTYNIEPITISIEGSETFLAVKVLFDYTFTPPQTVVPYTCYYFNDTETLSFEQNTILKSDGITEDNIVEMMAGKINIKLI